VAVAGTLGAKLVSLFGMVLAAAAAALIARHLRPDLGRPVLWATGLASPLFFDAWIVVAHTLGAACCGFATLAAIQALERRRARMLLAVVVLSAVAVLMRNEAVLFAGAMAFGGLAVSARRRSLPGLLVAGAAVIGAGIGYAVDTALTGLVASPDGPFVVGETLQSTSFLESRVEPTIRTLILPGHQLTGITGLLLLVALGAAVAAAVTVRERPGEHRRIIVLCGVAVGAVGLRLLGDPAAVPGLFAAFPLLAAGLLLLTADHLRRPPVTFMAVTSGVFVAAVLATQYEDGGGAQWGFRYAAVALPLLVPLAFLGLAEARDRLDPTTSVIATRLVAVLCVGAFGLALRTLHADHGATVHAIGAITDVVEDSDRPVVVTYDPAVGRLAWSSILDGQDWVLAEPGEMTSFAERLTRDGGDVVFVTYDADRELDAFARTHEVVERLPASPSGDLEVVRLVRR
jgi:MFS family permease